MNNIANKPARAVQDLQPDIFFDCKKRYKVLAILPLPRLVDTVFGLRVMYVRLDGTYARHPWDVEALVPADDQDD